MLRFFHIFIANTLFISTALAQVSSSKPIEQCDSNFAEQLVRFQASSSKDIKESDKRIRILILAADFLWETDEGYARSYLSSAFEIATKDWNQKKEEIETKTGPIIPIVKDLRFDVIRAISNKDYKWAESLIEKVLSETAKNEENNHLKNNRNALNTTLRIALSLSKNKPDIALKFFRQAMKFPISSLWYFDFPRISQINPVLANQIYKELILKKNNAEVSRLLLLSAYPFGTSKTFGYQTYFGAASNSNVKDSLNLQKFYLQILLKRISQLSPSAANKISDPTIGGGTLTESAHAFLAIKDIEPLIQTKFPDLSELFSEAKVTAISHIDEEAYKKIDRTNKSKKQRKKTFADKLLELEAADAEGKLNDSLIIETLSKLGLERVEEQYDLFEKWLDRIDDPQIKEKAKDYFYYERSNIAIRQNRLQDARRYAEKVSKLELRAVSHFYIAERKLKTTSTDTQANEILFEVYKIADKAPTSIQKAQVFLGLANMYEKFDHFNAMDSLSKAIKTTNKLDKPNIFNSSIRLLIKAPEITIGIGFRVPGFDLSKTFTAISKNDFQGALSQARSFDDTYIKNLAILSLAKSCKKNKAKSVKKNS